MGIVIKEGIVLCPTKCYKHKSKRLLLLKWKSRVDPSYIGCIPFMGSQLCLSVSMDCPREQQEAWEFGL